MGEVTESEMQRLRWQCRRGLLELDYIFENYLEQQYVSAPAQQRAQFRALLDYQDPDLQAWLLHGMAPPAGYEALVKLLRAED